jgi:hypothetical protein
MCVSTGGTPPGYINWPGPGFSNNGIELVDPAATNNAGQSSIVHLDCHSGLAHATNGNDTWYRVKLRFPANYQPPAVSSFNWLVEWHDDDHTACLDGNCGNGPVSMGMEVLTDGPECYCVGANPRLAFRLAGGSGSNPTYITRQMPSNSLRRDHWYDIVFHIVWSPSSTIGKFEWFVDGQTIDSEFFPTIYTNSDGTLSTNGFGLYNYHPALSWETRVDFDSLVIGPTQASLGG